MKIGPKAIYFDLQRVLLGKLRFLHMSFLEDNVQINKSNNDNNEFFMSKQVSLPKISLILQKMKIYPKNDINAPFCMEVYNVHIKIE